jgi:hypothetical protein
VNASALVFSGLGRLKLHYCWLGHDPTHRAFLEKLEGLDQQPSCHCWLAKNQLHCTGEADHLCTIFLCQVAQAAFAFSAVTPLLGCPGLSARLGLTRP